MKTYDFIIIGTGMGGSAAGFQLAKGGASVLFLEKGVDLTQTTYGFRGCYPETHFKNNNQTNILRAGGRYSEAVKDNKTQQSFIPFVGSGTGGSTSIYGMALERFIPADFTPSSNFSENEKEGSSTVTNWPITYDEISPYYNKIEESFGLSGTIDPLRKDAPCLKKAETLSKTNKYFFDHFKSKGAHPYQLPMACDYSKLKNESQGYLGDDGAKKDANAIFLKPSLEKYNAKIMTETEVINIASRGNTVKELLCKSGNNIFSIKCHNVILAAGAFQSTKLLLSSGNAEHPLGLANSSGLVGKNLMRHYVDLYAIKPEHPLNDSDPRRKQLAFNDFYHNDSKLGTFQSFGFLPPAAMVLNDWEEDLQKHGALISLFGKGIKPIVRHEIKKLIRQRVLFASIQEDLPYEKNQLKVCLTSGKISIDYTLSSSELNRISTFRKKIKNILNPLDTKLIKQAHSNQRIAHICGTCRFGDNPQESVLDKNNKAHDLENLYVLDSSFFPSSGGTNPSLTIAANALRISDHLLGKPMTQRKSYEKSSL